MNHYDPRDLLDERQQRAEDADRARLMARLLDDQSQEDAKWVISDPRGRRFLYAFMKSHGEDFTNPMTSFTGNSSTFFKEGMRGAAKNLSVALQKADPKSFLLMLQEHFLSTTEDHES